MEVAPEYRKIEINLIKLDSQNPRIKQFLENYVGIIAKMNCTHFLNESYKKNEKWARRILLDAPTSLISPLSCQMWHICPAALFRV